MVDQNIGQSEIIDKLAADGMGADHDVVNTVLCPFAALESFFPRSATAKNCRY